MEKYERMFKTLWYIKTGSTIPETQKAIGLTDDEMYGTLVMLHDHGMIRFVVG